MFDIVGRFDGHNILGSTTKTSNGCCATVSCPICGQLENADDHGRGRGEKQATAVALNKVIGHMKAIHNIKSGLPKHVIN